MSIGRQSMAMPTHPKFFHEARVSLYSMQLFYRCLRQSIHMDGCLVSSPFSINSLLPIDLQSLRKFSSFPSRASILNHFQSQERTHKSLSLSHIHILTTKSPISLSPSPPALTPCPPMRSRPFPQTSTKHCSTTLIFALSPPAPWPSPQSTISRL